MKTLFISATQAKVGLFHNYNCDYISKLRQFYFRYIRSSIRNQQ